LCILDSLIIYIPRFNKIRTKSGSQLSPASSCMDAVQSARSGPGRRRKRGITPPSAKTGRAMRLALAAVRVKELAGMVAGAGLARILKMSGMCRLAERRYCLALIVGIARPI
jgi:hypothetical protein